MSEQQQDAGATDDHGLLSQVSLIEEQPLAERAVAYNQMHDTLRAELEGGDLPNGHD